MLGLGPQAIDVWYLDSNEWTPVPCGVGESCRCPLKVETAETNASQAPRRVEALAVACLMGRSHAALHVLSLLYAAGTCHSTTPKVVHFFRTCRGQLGPKDQSPIIACSRIPD